MITISLCMIVKNEEKVLARCLDSIAGLMDEMIIVDTGSTDRTKEIASRYTDKIYDFEWVDDFSAARNFSFSKAHMEYIYTADADEVVDKENYERFRKLKQALLPEIEIVQMLYCNQLLYNTTYNFDEEYRPKLYKRLRTFVWTEAVHEAVRLEPVVYDSGIRITHCPESSHGARDFSLFLKIIKKQGTLSRKLHGMYARELFIAGEEEDFLQAEAYFKASVDKEERSMDELKEAVCVLTKIYRVKKDSFGLLKYAARDLASSPAAETCYELGTHYLEAGDPKEAYLWFYNAAFETESVLNIHYGSDYPLRKLAYCAKKLGDEKAAAEYERQAEAVEYA